MKIFKFIRIKKKRQSNFMNLANLIVKTQTITLVANTVLLRKQLITKVLMTWSIQIERHQTDLK